MKTQSLARALTLLVSCMAIASAGAAQSKHRIECPSEIAQDAMSVPKAPPGWKASVRGRMLLHAVDLSYGPPEEEAFLKPKDAGKSTDRWTGLRQKPPGTDGVWLACSYGKSDTMILAKRLDDKVAECSATYTKNKDGDLNIDFRCK